MNAERVFAARAFIAGTVALYVLGLGVLAARLKRVQLDDAAIYSYNQSRQAERRVQTDGVRGRILDRSGRILATNRRARMIVLNAECFQRRTWSATAQEMRAAITRAEEILGLKSIVTEKAISRHLNQRLARPLIVWRDVEEETLARFCEHARELAGFECEESDERTYPYGTLAAHLIGYVGRGRGEGQAGDSPFNFYDPEMRGRSGLEYSYDDYLRGMSGEERVLVDARGFATKRWTVVAAKCGPDLVTTIDAELQSVAEQVLTGVRGACVVLDPVSGDVLALASAPGYDLNGFVPYLPRTTYETLSKDEEKPLLNRASGGVYAPGSTFKPIVALAALEKGYDPETIYECVGHFDLNGLRIRCARTWGHGELDMPGALRESCNPYFCDLGMVLGSNTVISAARQFGLGHATGIDFGVDSAGVVPDDEWKRGRYSEKWFPGDLAQMSIGQGMLLVTPLQMACVAGALGTGELVTPHLVLGRTSARRRLPYAASAFEIVREGMRQVVTRGAGKPVAKDLEAWVIGKTGTAEVGSRASRRKNAWFIAYAESGARDEAGHLVRMRAPARRVALALVVEQGDSGGTTAAPRVNEVLRQVFHVH